MARDLQLSQLVPVDEALTNNRLTVGDRIQFTQDKTTCFGLIKAIRNTKSSIELELWDTTILSINKKTQTCSDKTNKTLYESVTIQTHMNNSLEQARITALRDNIEPLPVADKCTLLNNQYDAKLTIDPWLLQRVLTENLYNNTEMEHLAPIIDYFLHTCRIHIPSVPYPSPNAQADGWLLITHGHNQNNQHFDMLWALALYVIKNPATTDWRTACQIKQNAPDPKDAIADIIARGYTVESTDRMDDTPDPDAKQAPCEWNPNKYKNLLSL